MNWVAIVAGAVSLAFYWLFVIIFNTHAISSVFQPQIDNVYFRMFANFRFWLALIFLPIIALIPDASIKYFKMMYRPTVSDNTVKSRQLLKTKVESESDIIEISKTNKSSKKSKF